MRTSYKVDEFIDYAGNTRKFVIAAVSIQSNGLINAYDNEQDDFVVVNNYEKILSVGISVCRPSDEFDENLGVTIAEGKAIKNQDHAMYISDGGLVNNKLVDALLEQEAEFFKKDPGYYLAGYNNDAKKYQENKSLKEYEKTLEGDAKVTYNYLKSASSKELKAMTDMLCLRK